MPLIRIKRSGSTGSPTQLAQGELAYSFLTGTQSNGGDRLYVGTGTETSGVAANIEVIGGKYFTAMLDHVPGTLTASSALLVDSNSKVDQFNVDNIRLDLNTISTTNTNGDLILAPNGTGRIDASGKVITNAANPVANSDVVTYGFLQAFSGGGGGSLTITGDTGSDSVVVGTDTLDFNGGTGVTTSVGANQVTFSIGQDVSTTSNVTFNAITASSDLTVGGNLVVNGNTTFINVSAIDVEDSLIRLSANNAADTVDIGFVGRYINGANTEWAGLFRDATDGQFYIFRSYQDSDFSDNIIDRTAPSFNLGTLNATTFVGALSGNATTATTLQTSRNINGTAFNGSGDITITANTPNALTFNNGGSGAASGSTFNGGSAVTISHNTIGASPLAGSASLTTVGTVTTGTWNAGVIAGQYGGTGVNNTGRTITLNGNISTANNFTTTGNFPISLAATSTTSLTLPTTGTLATLTGTETFTNKTLTAPTISGGTATALTSLGVRSTGTGAFDLTLANSENLTAGRTLTLTLNDAARTINLAGNLTLANSLTTSGNFALTLTQTGATNVTLPTTGTLSTLAGTETFTNKTLTSPTINGGTHTALTSLGIRSTGTGAFDLTLANSENLTAGRTLTLTLNDAARTINLAGNLTLANSFTTSGNFALTLTQTAATNVTLPTTGTLATLAGTETFTNKTLTSPTIGTSMIATGASLAIFDTNATTITMGAVATTFTLGGATAASTTNIATGATTSGQTKTVNVGTGGAAGSTTNVNIGSAVAGTTTVNSPTLSATAVTATTFTGALSGNATTASTLQTSRTISLGGDLSGSASFNGGANITITATYGAIDGGTY